jgi:hypothetical protein
MVPVFLGSVVVTRNAADKLTNADVTTGLNRHSACDWGDLDDANWEKNNRAVLRGDDRLFSAYKTGNGVKFWSITEWDRSYTTVLLPSDY